MILIVHIIFGAAIGSIVKNIPLAIILAFLSHYFLDLIPHAEYPIKNLEKKQWRLALPDISQIVIDFLAGIILIVIFSDNQPIVYICGIIAAFPDSLTGLYYFLPKPNKCLKTLYQLHQKIHFFKHKKISNFWRVLSQITVVIVAIFLLRL